jgi:hypothetical protein
MRLATENATENAPAGFFGSLFIQEDLSGSEPADGEETFQ